MSRKKPRTASKSGYRGAAAKIDRAITETNDDAFRPEVLAGAMPWKDRFHERLNAAGIDTDAPARKAPSRPQRKAASKARRQKAG